MTAVHDDTHQVQPTTSARTRPTVPAQGQHFVPAQGQRSILADRIGRSLMAFNAFLTIGAIAYGITQLAQATPDTIVVEAWRTFGFLVFFSLNLLVAIWPRQIAAAWELILLHKIAVTVFAIAVGTAPEAEATAWIDGWLVLSTILAYVLTRGWTAWRTLSTNRATTNPNPTHA
jgi:hypothetical protein